MQLLLFHHFAGKDGSLQWRAVAVGASLPNTSSSKPRNAHAAVPLLGNNGVERATSADAASAEATSSEPKQSRADAESLIMVVIGGSTIEDGPTMDVLVLENANDARFVCATYLLTLKGQRREMSVHCGR